MSVPCGRSTPDGTVCRRRVSAPGAPCGAAHTDPGSPTGAVPGGAVAADAGSDPLAGQVDGLSAANLICSDARVLLRLVPGASQGDLAEVGREVRMGMSSLRAAFAGPGEAWNAFARARGGWLRMSVRCPECGGRGFMPRRPGPGYPGCHRCMGRRRVQESYRLEPASRGGLSDP